MNRPLVIMDMDGTLVDSGPAMRHACLASLSKWGVKAQYDDFQPYIGMGDDIFIGKVAEKYGVPYDFAMKEEAYRLYLATAKEAVEVYPWSKRLICDLYEMGCDLAIASASDRVKVECNIRCIGVEPELFQAIVTGSDVTRKKPFPDIFLRAMEKAGNKITPNRCFVLEDALSGVRAAKAAEMTCCAVSTSFTIEELQSVGADFVTKDLYDFVGYMKQHQASSV